MTLRINIFGFEVAKIELDIEKEEVPGTTSVAARGVKGISRLWVKGMMK